MRLWHFGAGGRHKHMAQQCCQQSVKQYERLIVAVAGWCIKFYYCLEQYSLRDGCIPPWTHTALTVGGIQ